MVRLSLERVTLGRRGTERLASPTGLARALVQPAGQSSERPPKKSERAMYAWTGLSVTLSQT